ncbi:MAG: hypothetical protein ACQSGP_07045 [Frankia sp.]
MTSDSPTPVAVDTTAPTSTPTAESPTPEVVAPVETSAAPTDTPTTSPPPAAEDGDTPITLPTVLPIAIPTDLLAGLPKQRLALSQRCVSGGVEWTVTNISKQKTGYAWLDTNLAWGIHVLAPGESGHLAKGFAVLVVPLSGKTGLPINLPLIDISHCGGSFPGGKTLPPISKLPISLGGGAPAAGGSGGGAAAAPGSVPVAPAATPVVTTNVHFTG